MIFEYIIMVIYMNGISIHELMKLYKPNIIDIRDNYSYNAGHIPNALNIPYYSLLTNYNIYLNISG